MPEKVCDECGKKFVAKNKVCKKCPDCRLPGRERDVVDQMANNHARWKSGWGRPSNDWWGR